MMDEHERQQEMVAAYALGRVDAADRAVVETHLRDCPACAALVREYQDIAGVLAFGLALETPPPEARAFVLERVAPRHAVAPLPRQAAPRRPAPWWQPLPSLRWAMVAVLLLGLLGWNIRLQRAVATSTEIARLAGQAGAPALMVNTPAAPGASAQLYLAEDGRRGVLAIANLPVPPPGSVYQFWFARPDKSRDSAAVFQVGANGEALLNVTVPGALDQYNEIWITQEPEGGSEVPTPPHFLEGPL